MRSPVAILMMMSLPAASGCLSVLSQSYAYSVVDRRPEVSETAWTSTFFHVTDPLIENLVVDLTHELEGRCAGRGLVNVQTKLSMREFIVVQTYSIRLSAGCSLDGPRAGSRPEPPSPDAASARP